VGTILAEKTPREEYQGGKKKLFARRGYYGPQQKTAPLGNTKNLGKPRSNCAEIPVSNFPLKNGKKKSGLTQTRRELEKKRAVPRGPSKKNKKSDNEKKKRGGEREGGAWRLPNP